MKSETQMPKTDPTPITEGPYKGLNIIHLTAISGSVELMQYLLEERKCPVTTGPEEKSPITIAAMKGTAHLVSYLIKKQNPQLSYQQTQEQLQQTIQAGQKQLIEELTEAFNQNDQQKLKQLNTIIQPGTEYETNGQNNLIKRITQNAFITRFVQRGGEEIKQRLKIMEEIIDQHEDVTPDRNKYKEKIDKIKQKIKQKTEEQIKSELSEIETQLTQIEDIQTEQAANQGQLIVRQSQAEPDAAKIEQLEKQIAALEAKSKALQQTIQHHQESETDDSDSDQTTDTADQIIQQTTELIEKTIDLIKQLQKYTEPKNDDPLYLFHFSMLVRRVIMIGAVTIALISGESFKEILTGKTLSPFAIKLPYTLGLYLTSLLFETAKSILEGATEEIKKNGLGNFNAIMLLASGILTLINAVVDLGAHMGEKITDNEDLIPEWAQFIIWGTLIVPSLVTIFAHFIKEIAHTLITKGWRELRGYNIPYAFAYIFMTLGAILTLTTFIWKSEDYKEFVDITKYFTTPGFLLFGLIGALMGLFSGAGDHWTATKVSGRRFIHPKILTTLKRQAAQDPQLKAILPDVLATIKAIPEELIQQLIQEAGKANSNKIIGDAMLLLDTNAFKKYAEEMGVPKAVIKVYMDQVRDFLAKPIGATYITDPIDWTISWAFSLNSEYEQQIKKEIAKIEQQKDANKKVQETIKKLEKAPP